MDNKYIVIAATVLVLAAVAIGFTVMNDSSEEDDEKSTVTITDLAGREVKISYPVERIVCGDAEAMSMIAAVAGEDFGDMLVGYDSNLHTYYPDVAKMWSDAIDDFDKKTPVGSFQDGSFNWETVASLNPDVVFIPMWIYAYGMMSEETVNQMANAGIAIVNLDLYVDLFNEEVMDRNCEVLGKIFKNEDKAKEIGDFYGEQINAVSKISSGITPNEKSYYIEMLVQLGNYGNGKPSSPTGDLEYLYQKNIMTSGNGVINAEDFATSGVEYVFFMTFNGFAECGSHMGWGATVTTSDIEEINESLAKRNGWTNTPAVQNGNIIFFDQVFNCSFENWFIYQVIAQAMYPNLYSTLDPVDNLEGFYEEYLPWVDLKGVWYFTSDGEIGATA